MNKVLCRSLVLALGVALVSSAAYAKKTVDSGYSTYSRTTETSQVPGLDNPAALQGRGLAASAAQGTTFLATYTFDTGASCNTQGWTTVDITKPDADYWHIDDFITTGGGPDTLAGYFPAIEGAKSLWCGTRPDPGSQILCGYVDLPGYGNNWSQNWCTKACIPVAGNLDVSFHITYDSEPGYDFTYVEWTTDCTNNLNFADEASFDGYQVDSTFAGSFNIGGATPVRVRIRFTADGAWSDQDGLYSSFSGAAIIDLLQAEGLAVEDFESEAVGATSADDWQACNSPGYGNQLSLFKKNSTPIGANYEDICAINLGCYWAAILNSSVFYTCGSPPQGSQRVVPYINPREEYIDNEIWSPVIPMSGTGGEFRLRYTVYRDLPLDNLIFHVWHVRTIVGGCPQSWRDFNFVYYGDFKDWIIADNNVGPRITAAGTATHVQLAIGVTDMCPVWCFGAPGGFGSGACHSPAPYLDQVKLLRIATTGPQWDVRAIDTFQDNFAQVGAGDPYRLTDIGKSRADEAIDVMPGSNPAILPGDSATVTISDPLYATLSGSAFSGLKASPVPAGPGYYTTFRRKAYCYVAVWPQGQPTKVGEGLSGGYDEPGWGGIPMSMGPGAGQNRWPHIPAEDLVINGVTWTALRMDFAFANGNGDGDPTIGALGPYFGFGRVNGRFCIDLNDNLFTPGDTVCYFYGARSNNAPETITFYSTSWGTTANSAEVAANPMEFTILPAGGNARGGDILYVDGADGQGDQPFFDGAFQLLGLLDKVDRYDVRGPSSGVSNRPGHRVQDVAGQLNANYRKILWDTGINEITLGDGSGVPEKVDDYFVVNAFLANLSNPGGVYLCGDRIAQLLTTYSGASATVFQSTYMEFNLVDSNHRNVLPVSPAGVRNPLGLFTDDMVLAGGCPLLNDFDVLQEIGASVREMSYGAPAATNGAVLSHVSAGDPNERVVLSGFSFAYIRDDELDGVSDRAQHLHDIIVWLGNILGQPTAAGPALKNELSQNYPNPFNPQTTIAFSIKERGAVSIKVYNVAGQLVRTLANENRAAGPYTVVWDGRNDSGQPVSSGVYFYKLVANNFSQTKKMVLLK